MQGEFLAKNHYDRSLCGRNHADQISAISPFFLEKAYTGNHYLFGEGTSLRSLRNAGCVQLKGCRMDKRFLWYAGGDCGAVYGTASSLEKTDDAFHCRWNDLLHASGADGVYIIRRGCVRILLGKICV